MLVKLAPNGTAVWNATWGNPLDDEFNCIFSNGTSLFVGGYSCTDIDTQGIFAEFDPAGGLHGARTWGVVMDSESANGICVIGSSIFACGNDILNIGGFQGFIARFTSLQSGTPKLQSWDHAWGGNYATDFNDIAIYGGSLYVTGFATNCYSLQDVNLVVMRYGTRGNLLSNFTWNVPGKNYGHKIIVNAGCIYVAALWDRYVSGKHMRLLNLVKFDGNGNHVWNRTWGNSTFDSIGINSMVMNGTDIFVTGAYHVNSKPGFDVDAYIVKFDGNGTQAWNVTTGVGTKYDTFNAISIDGGIIRILGSIDGNGLDPHMVLNNYDALGNFINSTLFGTKKDGISDAIFLGNNFYIAGTTTTVLLSKYTEFVAKIDKRGNELWRMTWNKDGYDWSIGIATNGSNLFVIGESVDKFYNTVSNLLELDLNGRLLETYVWNVSSQDQASDVACMNDMVYVAGVFDDNGTSDAYLAKFLLPTLPSISSPSDVQFVHGTTSNAITWNATDETTNAPWYTVRRNGTLIANATWTSGVPIVVNIDGLEVGVHVIIITVNDGYGNTITDEVQVTVTSSPSNSPGPQDYSGIVVAIILIVIGGLVVVGIFQVRSLVKTGVVTFKKKRE